jgi:hypothetical protein
MRLNRPWPLLWTQPAGAITMTKTSFSLNNDELIEWKETAGRIA